MQECEEKIWKVFELVEQPLLDDFSCNDPAASHRVILQALCSTIFWNYPEKEGDFSNAPLATWQRHQMATHFVKCIKYKMKESLVQYNNLLKIWGHLNNTGFVYFCISLSQEWCLNILTYSFFFFLSTIFSSLFLSALDKIEVVLWGSFFLMVFRFLDGKTNALQESNFSFSVFKLTCTWN